MELVQLLGMERCPELPQVCSTSALTSHRTYISSWFYQSKPVPSDCMCSLVWSSTISYSRKDSEAAGAKARLRDLEAQLNSKDALLATAVSEKRSLEVSLADLQEQMQEVFHCAPSFSSSATWLFSIIAFLTSVCASVIPAGCRSHTSQETALR